MNSDINKEFRLMLVDLSDRIGESDLDTMKYYCRQDVARIRLEEATRAIHLWEALEERGLISPNDTSFLQKLFEKVLKRIDLFQSVVDYERKVESTSDESSAYSVNQSRYILRILLLFLLARSLLYGCLYSDFSLANTSQYSISHDKSSY